MRRRTRRPVPCALLVGLFIGCGCGHGTGGAPAHADGLSSDDIALYAQVLSAADARGTDTAIFARALAARARPVRIEGARAIGQSHAVATAPLLRRTLDDPDTAVAATAAYALGLLRDTGSVPALARALSGAPTVGAEAAWALGEIGAPARASIETGLSTSSGATTSVRENLLLAAAKLRPMPIEAVKRYLPGTSAPLSGDASSVQRVVRAAAYAVARQRAPAGMRALAALASSGDPDTRLSVARGLTRASTGDSLATAARQTLGALVHDRDPDVRAAAVQSLASFGEAERDRVTAALRDSNTNVRVAAAGVLDRVLGADPVAWVAASGSDTSFTVSRTIVADAARVGVVLPAIAPSNPRRWQRDSDWRRRAAVADAAAGMALPRMLVLIEPLLHDADGRVRVAAYSAVSPWVDSTRAPDHETAWAAVTAALVDEDPYVRSTALGALAGRARASEVELGLQGYRRGQTDTVADARIAALELLSAVWLRDSAHVPDSLRAAISTLSVPADLREIAAVGQGSIWSAWRRPGTTRPVHPLAWYDSVVRAVVVPTLAGHPYTATIRTVRGPLTITLFGDAAPLTVANFIALARASYYRGTMFHRVVPAFVVQDGDPRGDGNGGPAHAIRDEFNRSRYDRGTLGMALSGPDTGGSQYFLTLTPQPHLDGHYTVFGTLRDGFQALDLIVQGDGITDVVIE